MKLGIKPEEQERLEDIAENMKMDTRDRKLANESN